MTSGRVTLLLLVVVLLSNIIKYPNLCFGRGGCFDGLTVARLEGKIHDIKGGAVGYRSSSPDR